MIKTNLKKKIPRAILVHLQKVHYWLYCRINKQGKPRAGYQIKGGKKNDDKQYLVIRYSIPGMGILAVYRGAISAIKYALDNGYIPLIDYEWEEDYSGKMLNINNHWSYVFNQPMLVDFEDIKGSKNIKVGDIAAMYYDIPYIEINDYKSYYKKWGEMGKKYCTFNVTSKERFEKTFTELFKNKGKILGICLRDGFSVERELGMDYMSEHPKEPEINEIFEKVDLYMEKWNCDTIYLTAQFENTVILFEEKYGDSVVCTERKRIRVTDNYRKFLLNFKNSNKMSSKEHQEIYEKYPEYSIENKDVILDYVEEIYGLSLCNYLIATKNGGTIGALIFNEGKYEDIYVFNDENCSVFY